MGQFISFKSEINNPWFNPWFVLLHTHSNVCATVDWRCLEYLVCITLTQCSNPSWAWRWRHPFGTNNYPPFWHSTKNQVHTEDPRISWFQNSWSPLFRDSFLCLNFVNSSLFRDFEKKSKRKYFSEFSVFFPIFKFFKMFFPMFFSCMYVITFSDSWI